MPHMPLSSITFPMPAENEDSWDNMRRWLVGYRKNMCMTQAEVAERMGVSQSRVSDLERGVVTDPYVSTITRWVRALGLRPSLDAVDLETGESLLGRSR